MTEPVIHVTQEHREVLIGDTTARTFRKRSRIVAVVMHQPFTVETDHGVARGEAGDWLATGHPADVPKSDLWPISADIMASTYEPAD